MHRRFRFVRLFAATLPVLIAGGAQAADLTHTGISNKEPVLLTANEVGYDEPNSTATAIGKVEVVQGDTILLADRVTYNQDTDVVHATGNVSLLEPDGTVVFSNDAVLRDKLEKGVVQQFRVRLKDNSLFAAREGQKINKNVTRMKDAVYSPCNVCQPAPGETPSAPLWQMRADTVTVNEETQRVTYRNAFMDVWGVPAFYTPYFSHPTPDAPSQSGLLLPSYFHASDLGSVVKEPVYINIAPNMDMTLTPWYMSGEKPLMEGEFRHLTPEGSYFVRGAVTDTYNRDDLGNVIPGDEVRGYIEAHGKLQLSEHWDAGIDAERTTDDTFLQLYRFGWQDMLTSRIYAERIEDRNYAVIESMAFQGLQEQDVGSQSPYILPQATVHLESDPMMAHSRFTYDGSALVLQRDEGDSDQRVSSSVGWKLPYVTSGGQIFETKASVRADAYNVNDLPLSTMTNTTFNGQTGRIIPELDFDWRYPFINRFGEGKSLMLTPVVEMAASPNLRMASNIPNEDSQLAELSDINLFSPDRFTGLDEVESGPRGTFGMRGQLQLADQKYIEWLFGQAYQENEASPFPLATAQVAHFSDYIGHLAIKYKWIDISYSFRLDRQNFQPTSNEVNTTFNMKPFSFDLTFISLQNEPLFGDRKEVFGGTSVDLTDHWRWNVSGRRDLGSTELVPVNSELPVSVANPLEPSSGTVGLSTGIVFHNECMMVTTSLGRSYISLQDVQPSTTFSVVLVLKNFGSTEGTSTPSNTNGPGNITSVDSEASTAHVSGMDTQFEATHNVSTGSGN